jgi:3-oxoacyl-[acyl-carrier protein] reductase
MSVAIITGSSRGLGRALVETLLAEGWTVHGFARSAQAFAHPHFHPHAVDVGDESAVAEAVADVLATSGRVDLLINNAGAASMNALLLTPAATAAALMRVNYLGAWHCLQAVGKAMVRQRSGLVVNLTTVAVPLSLSGEAAYVASKAAVEALTKVAAAELQPQGVRVHAVGLGPLATDLTRAVGADKLGALNQRIGRPHGTSLAEAVDFIAQAWRSPAADTGTIRYLGSFC